MKRNSTLIALFVIVASLLALNLIISMGSAVRTAQADIVQGKNIFSTTSPDGQTVYIWGYSQTGSFNDAKVNAVYFGEISVGGSFHKP
jgi:hypothetical protein